MLPPPAGVSREPRGHNRVVPFPRRVPTRPGHTQCVNGVIRVRPGMRPQTAGATRPQNSPLVETFGNDGKRVEYEQYEPPRDLHYAGSVLGEIDGEEELIIRELRDRNDSEVDLFAASGGVRGVSGGTFIRGDGPPRPAVCSSSTSAAVGVPVPVPLVISSSSAKGGTATSSSPQDDKPPGGSFGIIDDGSDGAAATTAGAAAAAVSAWRLGEGARQEVEARHEMRRGGDSAEEEKDQRAVSGWPAQRAA